MWKSVRKNINLVHLHKIVQFDICWSKTMNRVLRAFFLPDQFSFGCISKSHYISFINCRLYIEHMLVHRVGIGVLVGNQGIRHIPGTLCYTIPHYAIAFLSL